MSNSKQISKSVVGGSSPTWLEHPTAAESEVESMSRNLFWFRAQPARVIMPPLQLPVQQVMYAPQPMSGVGGSYMSLQMPQSVVRTTGPSPAMSAGNSRAHQPAGGSGNKRKCRTNRVCDLIDALSPLMPYPPKEDAASTLSDVIDYITLTQREIQQLEEKLAWQRSRLIAGMQYQGTAAQGYSIPGSLIGSGQMPNQMVGTHVVPAIGFPVNQADAAAAFGNHADDDAAAVGNHAVDAVGKQAVDAAAAVGKQAVDDAVAAVGNQVDDAAVVNQATDAAALEVQEMIQENFAFGETNDLFFINPNI